MNKLLRSKYSPWLLVMAVALCTYFPVLFQKGMFFDGLQYAIVSKNMAHGFGSFWFPQLNDCWNKMGEKAFMEHPPLVYFLQSVYFKLFGEYFYTEKLYCLTTLLVTCLLTIKIWRELFRQDAEIKKFCWLPILFLLITDTGPWSFSNNMQENTMTIFILLSVYWNLIFIRNRNFIFLLGSSVSIFLAFLCKGLPGLFPLVFFIIYSLTIIRKEFLKFAFYSFIQLVIIALLFFVLIYFSDDAKTSLWFYIKQRVLERITNEPTVSNRFFILYRFLQDYIFVFVLLLFIFLILKFVLKSPFKLHINHNYFLLFTFLSLSGLLPLCLTKVQRAAYFLPAMPFFCIALAIAIKDSYDKILIFLNKKVIITSFIMTIIVALIFNFCNFGNILRDEEQINNSQTLYSITGPNITINSTHAAIDDWAFYFYLLRYYDITLCRNKTDSPYFIISKNERDISVENYFLIKSIGEYNLYKKLNSN